MPEAFVWPEGYVWLFTGSMAASAVIAYAENTQITPSFGWDNRAAADGTYADHKTGQRCDVNIQAIYTVSQTITKIMESATAVHMKFLHSGVNGSAGHWLYSGRIDNYQVGGKPGQAYMYNIKAHFNVWSAF